MWEKFTLIRKKEGHFLQRHIGILCENAYAKLSVQKKFFVQLVCLVCNMSGV